MDRYSADAFVSLPSLAWRHGGLATLIVPHMAGPSMLRHDWLRKRVGKQVAERQASSRGFRRGRGGRSAQRVVPRCCLECSCLAPKLTLGLSRALFAHAARCIAVVWAPQAAQLRSLFSSARFVAPQRNGGHRGATPRTCVPRLVRFLQQVVVDTCHHRRGLRAEGRGPAHPRMGRRRLRLGRRRGRSPRRPR